MNGGASLLDSIAVLDLTLETVEENLALDEALLIDAQERQGGGVLRFWEAPSLAVILGASRRIADDVRLASCQEDRVSVLRRTSGGGTVVIGPGALNVTLVLPETAAPGLSAVAGAQHFVLERIAEGLRSAERPVKLLGLGDLTLGGRKFAGSAQRRIRDWFLVHCSILYEFPLDRISRYLNMPGRQPDYRAGRSHNDFLMNFGLPRKIVLNLIGRAWSPAFELAPRAEAPRQLVKDLLSERFANRSWIERL